MAGAAPVEVEVREVPEDQKVGGFGDVLILEEVLVGDEGRTRPFWFSKGTEPPKPGEVVKGWWNTVKSGNKEGERYFRRADDENGAQRRSGGSSRQEEMSPDRTRSIERQTCAKAAGPTLAALTKSDDWRKTFAEDSRFIVDALHAAVRGE